MRTFVDKLMDDDDVQGEWKEIADWLEEAGIEQDELHTPTGAAGAAMWMDHTASDEPVEFGVLLVADFGDHAEAMRETIRRALDTAERKGDAELDEDNYGESTIITLSHFADRADDADDTDEAETNDAPFGDAAAHADKPTFRKTLARSLDEVHLAWLDDTLVVSNRQRQVENAIDHADGRKIDSLAGASVYQRSRSQHAEDVDAFAGLFLSAEIEAYGRDLLERGYAGMGGGAVGPLAAIRALGLSSFEGASVGLHLSGEAGGVESSLGVLMPEKSGLVSLLAGVEGPFQLPSFIPADAASVTSFHFQFDKVFQVAGGVIDTLPEQGREQAHAALQMFENTMGPALKSLDPHVFSVRMIERPLSAESDKSVLIIRTSDALAFVNAFGGFAPMLRMEARDFAGNPIYEDTTSDAAVGVGFGHVFIGSPVQVENLMRRAGHPDEEGLGSDEAFTASASRIAGDAVVHSWSDTRKSIEYAIWMMHNAEKIAVAGMEQAAEEWDYELDESDRAMMTEHIPAWYESVPSAEVFTRHLGDSLFVLRSTPDGFRGKSITLPAK